MAGRPPSDPLVEVKVRYRSKPIPATIATEAGGTWRVEFSEPKPAPAPGQSAVFYDGDEVLGGGVIDDVLRADG